MATLNVHIAQASQLALQKITNDESQASTTPWPPLRSAHRFHQTWSLISAETEVEKAEKRVPDNAGPLNSQRLVLHTLGLMRSLSPEYLQAFLAQAETLLWLEQAQGLPRAGTPAKHRQPQAAKAARPRKR